MKNLKLINLFSFCLLVILMASPINNNIYGQKAKAFNVTVKGKGKPMIMIHGYASSGTVWNELSESLKDNYECHLLNLAGFAGQKGVLCDNYTDFITNALISYIKEKKLDNPIIVGHSMGGFLALKLGIAVPKQIGPVVIVDGLAFIPAIMNPNATEENQLSMAQTYFKYDSIPVGKINSQPVEQIKKYVSTMTNSLQKVDTLINWSLKSDDRICNQAMFELFTTDLRVKIKEIESPILVFGTWVAYKQYNVTKESSLASYKDQYKNAKNLTVKISDDGRHFLMWDSPDWLLSEINAFLLNTL